MADTDVRTSHKNLFRIIKKMDWSSIFENLTLNIITEVLGIIVTVLIIDRIIKRNEDRRWKPVKSALFVEVFRSIQDILYQMPIEFTTTPSKYYLFGNSSASSRVEIIEPFPSPDPLIQALEQRIQHTHKINVINLLDAYRRINNVVDRTGFMLPPELLELILELNNGFRVLERIYDDDVDFVLNYEKRKQLATLVSSIMNSSYEINKWLIEQADECFDDIKQHIEALMSNAQKIAATRSKKE